MRALGLIIGFLLDRAVGDPQRYHPVAGLGQLATRLEKVTYRDTKAAGLVHLGLLLGGGLALGLAGERIAKNRPWLRLLATATATWAVLGGRSLAAEGEAISSQLAADDLPAARQQLTHLVSRDVTELSADEVARAATESIAENTSDAVLAPLLWGGLLGLPGLIGHRIVNTLDAMIGYRNDRYRNFGWAAARLDDLLGFLPARLGAILVWLAADPEARPRVTQAAWRDSAAHPSPNGGVIEGAFAGALGVTLGGDNVYAGQVESRGRLGQGPNPTPKTLVRAERLMWAISLGGLAISAGLAVGITNLGCPRKRKAQLWRS